MVKINYVKFSNSGLNGKDATVEMTDATLGIRRQLKSCISQLSNQCTAPKMMAFDLKQTVMPTHEGKLKCENGTLLAYKTFVAIADQEKRWGNTFGQPTAVLTVIYQTTVHHKDKKIQTVMGMSVFNSYRILVNTEVLQGSF